MPKASSEQGKPTKRNVGKGMRGVLRWHHCWVSCETGTWSAMWRRSPGLRLRRRRTSTVCRERCRYTHPAHCFLYCISSCVLCIEYRKDSTLHHPGSGRHPPSAGRGATRLHQLITFCTASPPAFFASHTAQTVPFINGTVHTAVRSLSSVRRTARDPCLSIPLFIHQQEKKSHQTGYSGRLESTSRRENHVDLRKRC